MYTIELLPEVNENDFRDLSLPREYRRIAIHKGNYVKIIDFYKDEKGENFERVVSIMEKIIN